MGIHREVINPPAVADTVKYGFSQAVMVRGGCCVYLSGQVGIDAEERIAGPDIGTQAEAALDNIAIVLESLGGDLSQVVMLQLNVAEFARYEQESVTQVLCKRFPIDPPATSWTIVRGLAEPEWLIEIVAEAVLEDLQKR